MHGKTCSAQIRMKENIMQNYRKANREWQWEFSKNT